jgi:MazG family protein
MNNSTADATFSELLAIVKRLRTDCPWDREQTHQSLTAPLLEETYEVIEAIETSDMPELKKELGDVLLHVVFQSMLAEETSDFTINDVIRSQIDKLIFRHPHVFGDTKVSGTAEVKKNWEMLKKQEGKVSVLDGVPQQLPALQRAARIQEKAAKLGFDWDSNEGVINKISEEIAEFKAETDPIKRSEEFGDILFSLVNYSRHANIDAEAALRGSSLKFERRFRQIEPSLQTAMTDNKHLSLDEMDVLWNEVKTAEKGV